MLIKLFISGLVEMVHILNNCILKYVAIRGAGKSMQRLCCTNTTKDTKDESSIWAIGRCNHVGGKRDRMQRLE